MAVLKVKSGDEWIPVVGSDSGGGVPIEAGGGGETCGRLTVGSGDPEAQGTSGTIFYTPYRGNQIPLYNGQSWDYTEFPELSLSLSPYGSGNAVHGTLYDVFMFLDGETPKLTMTAWSPIVDTGGNISPQARIDQLTADSGILVATSDRKKRYLGTIKVDSIGQTQNNPNFRHVWNMANRHTAICDDLRPYASYTVGPTGWRRMGGTDYRIEFVSGLPGGMYTGFLSLLTSGVSGNRYYSLATAVNGPIREELQSSRLFPNVANFMMSFATSGLMTADLGVNILYAVEAVDGVNTFVNYVGTEPTNRHTGGLKGAWEC